MTNLTPAQLEQFESTFRYFDRDESNTLNQSEMTAALASLGIVYSVSTRNTVVMIKTVLTTADLIGRGHGLYLRSTSTRLRRHYI